ncbi:MAG: indole-3-glycerol-phosphate synthase [Steroidobacteraceae bacterium]
MNGDFLTQMAQASRGRVNAAREMASDATLMVRALATPPPVMLQLSDQGFDLIAEVKLRSPAVGALKPATEDLAARVESYATAGAAAVSILTEPSHFDGTLAHLELGVRALGGRIPAMRKDFLVDPYQVMEARIAGAGGVLVILRMLNAREIDALLDCAGRLDLFVLLEAFDAADIEIAHRLVAQRRGEELLVGVNCRDLQTLQVVPGRLEALGNLLPDSVPRVAESGVANADDARRMVAAGYDLALVGSALMTSEDPSRLLRELLAAGRGA